jgi:hypothetical protein
MPSPARLLLAIPLLLPATLSAGTPDVSAFFDSQCMECHDAEMKKGGLDLDSLKWNPADHTNFDRWVKLFDRVERGEMPPAKKPRPEPAALTAFLKSLGTPLHEFDAKRQAESGRTVLRRLNRTEYENTLHDLLAIDTPLREILPEDTPLHGFDTVADGLRLSAMHLEKYLETADLALEDALRLTTKPPPIKGRFFLKDEKDVRKHLDTAVGFVRDKNSGQKHQHLLKELPDAVVFFNEGYPNADIKQIYLRVAGEYRIRASAYVHQSSGTHVGMRINAHRYSQGKRTLASFDLEPDKPREVEIVTRLGAGEVLQLEPFGSGFDAKGKNIYGIGAEAYQGVGVAFQWFEIEGPILHSWPPESVKRLVGDMPVTPREQNKWEKQDPKARAFDLAPADPKAACHTAITSLAQRAFRRPLEPGETDRFVKLSHAALDAGVRFEDALRIGLRAILTAPQFLLFEEKPGKLDEYALASRLSYFLWSSMPDDELLAAAAAKKLHDPATLHAQTERMLNSPKARAFVKNFTGQWLQLRNIDATTPDKKLYPEFDDILKFAMIGETEAFFTEMLQADLPVSNFIHSDFAMLNRRLADHYGVPGVQGEQFRKVSLPAESPRGGLLTQASVLKVTANGTVSSPVLRGAWVMKHLLGRPPQPPPPNVGSVEPDTRGATTIRELLDKHRNTESCMGCHSRMDPPGFALESFDVIGGWRDRYRSVGTGDWVKQTFRGRGIYEYKHGPKVDASGALPDGRTFTDITSYKKLLLADEPQLARCVTEKFLTYGTGAGIHFADRNSISAILQKAAPKQHGLRSLVHEVIQSPAFLNK